MLIIAIEENHGLGAQLIERVLTAGFHCRAFTQVGEVSENVRGEFVGNIGCCVCRAVIDHDDVRVYGADFFQHLLDVAGFVESGKNEPDGIFCYT